jgi:hypothetical protein
LKEEIAIIERKKMLLHKERSEHAKITVEPM